MIMNSLNAVWITRVGALRQAIAPAVLLAVMTLHPIGADTARAAEPVAAAVTAGDKMQFPDGTATPSEVCGACHKELYREYSEGIGSDLDWKPMKFWPASKERLALPPGSHKSGTAHALAKTDPWPIEAMRLEEDGRECNVCHAPAAFDYPDMKASPAVFEKVKPRTENKIAGITCASCHLTPDGKIRGPYVVNAPHETVADERTQTSAACARCHGEGERVIGKQTQTSLEWLEDFNKPGLGRQQCQECHMPKTVRKLAEDFDVPPRPVARHLWTGGHSFQRVASALNLAVTQATAGEANVTFRVTNVGAGHSVPTGSNRRAIYLTAEVLNAKGKVVATKEWMFAPWMLGRPDDPKYLEEDKKGHDPIATSQADLQGPHETIIRAGETRILEWAPTVAKGQYTVRTTLTYDLNRYNDRAFKDDQHQLAQVTTPLKIDAPVTTAAPASKKNVLAQAATK